MGLIHIGGKTYEIWHENRNGWNAEAFRDRYSEVLERYDFIVGDWGYNQLRLKGFFRDNHQKATKESSFSGMSDYINEYCNFGCAYFVLEKTQNAKKEPDDYDLDGDDYRPRLEAADLLAAAGGGLTEEPEAEEAAEHEIASAREAVAVQPQTRHHRHHRSDQRHGGGSNRQNNDKSTGVSVSDADVRANNDTRAGKREYQPRKNYRGNDHRGKKPFRLAAGETAAASAEPKPSKKNAERS